MKNILKISCLVFSFFVFNLAVLVAENYQVDPVHSSLNFNIDHLMISEVDGKFTQFEGSVDFNEKTKKLKDINAKIYVDSINTANEKRDVHLKDQDFFNVKKYPHILFKSTSIKRRKDKYTVIGDLTMHGVTKEIKLKGKLKGIVNDKKFGNRIGFVAEGEIDRRDFDLKYNSVLEAGGVTIGHEVEIELSMQLIKK